MPDPSTPPPRPETAARRTRTQQRRLIHVTPAIPRETQQHPVTQMTARPDQSSHLVVGQGCRSARGLAQPQVAAPRACG
jgi:hypothetical protein